MVCRKPQTWFDYNHQTTTGVWDDFAYQAKQLPKQQILCELQNNYFGVNSIAENWG